MQQFLSACADPMTVHAVEGEVVILGPDRVAVSLTIDAAEESARRLIAAAKAARGQPPGEREPSQDSSH